MGLLKAWWAIISKSVRCRPERPTESRSLRRMQGCEIVSGLAGGGVTPLVTNGWKSAIEAMVR